jgi:hypothetical protein
VGDDLVAEAEDFVVWQREGKSLAVRQGVVHVTQYMGMDAPSLLQAAVSETSRPSTRANRACGFIGVWWW